MNESQGDAFAPAWDDTTVEDAMGILKKAQEMRRPVVLLLGAGTSVDSGFPLASQLMEYLVHVSILIKEEGFTNVRNYVAEMRWPSRHDLRVSLLKRKRVSSLREILQSAERDATQAAMLSELRRHAPTLASSLQEVFAQLQPDHYRAEEFREMYGQLRPLAEQLCRKSPRNIAYRSLLFHLCENDQTTIDACFDHFVRDRMPTTTHQFVYFLCRAFDSRIIFTTNFDPLLEQALNGEGLIPRVYEIHGEGSIPSPQLLTSQPLSIVKLHGGSHQMQTGFDLDDPLSPAALASFANLYRNLEELNGQPPLTVVMGYSGSDRRVMDIVSDQVASWQPPKPTECSDGDHGIPRVLWVSREAWAPVLLSNAVESHPYMLQRAPTNVAIGSGVSPARMVRYRDARLFMLEAIQRLTQHFPIARRRYQAVNFVPSCSGARYTQAAISDHLKETWSVAFVHAPPPGTGSSSLLVALTEELERREQSHNVWIDLAEISSVSALFDVVSERLTKVDARLQALRRPPLLTSLFSGLIDEPSFKKASKNSEDHEISMAVQWLRHALRRGKYVLAFDAVDEFPNQHPALMDLKSENKNVTLEQFKNDQQELLHKVIRNLAANPELLGDSRIAFAYSDPRKAHQSDSYRRLLDELSRQEARNSRVKVINANASRPIITTRPAAINSFEEFRNTHLNGNEIEAAIILAACCARRLRSEVSLSLIVGDFLGRVEKHSEEQSDLWTRFVEGAARVWEDPLPISQNNLKMTPASRNEEILNELRKLTNRSAGAENNSTTMDRVKIELRRTEGGYHWMHRDTRNDVYTLTESATLSKDGSTVENAGTSVLAAFHHATAIFYYDELYERSRDPRAFLEYLFHRLATVRLAIKARKWESALGWGERILIAVERQKHALLTGARLPSLIWNMIQFHVLWLKVESSLKRDSATYAVDLDRTVRVSRKIHAILSDFLLACGHPHEALLCCLRTSAFEISIQRRGHLPHLSVALSNSQNSCANMEIAANPTPNPPTNPPPADQPPSPVKKIECDLVAKLRSYRDVAYACHDPLLSVIPIPRFIDKVGKTTQDWLSRQMQEPCVDEQTNGKQTFEGSVWRDARLTYSENQYRNARTLGEGDKADQANRRLEWSEHNALIDVHESCIRRQLEYVLLWYPESWIESSVVYLSGVRSDDKAETEFQPLAHLREFLTTVEERRGKEEEREKIQALVKQSETPVLRSTPRSLRHECYRLCLTARLKAAELLHTRPNSEGKRLVDDEDAICKLVSKESSLFSEWNTIERMLKSAEAMLDRSGTPADRQAMAITRLTHAELLVRMAEILEHGADLILKFKKGNKNADTEGARNSSAESVDNLRHKQRLGVDLRFRSGTLLTEAFNLLQTVESLMNEGRGENRWRFVYLLTLGRCHLLTSKRAIQRTQRDAMIHLHWSARFIIGAMTNCGYWTDRYYVLLWWWDTWKLVAKDHHRLNDDNETNWNTRSEVFVAGLCAELGIRWADEERVERFV